MEEQKCKHGVTRGIKILPMPSARQGPSLLDLFHAPYGMGNKSRTKSRKIIKKDSVELPRLGRCYQCEHADADKRKLEEKQFLKDLTPKNCYPNDTNFEMVDFPRIREFADGSKVIVLAATIVKDGVEKRFYFDSNGISQAIAESVTELLVGKQQ